MKKKACVLIFLFCFLYVNTVFPSFSTLAIEQVDAVGNTNFNGLSLEKMLIIYERMDDPDNQYRSFIDHYDNFMESYFDNLTINHGKNIIGSCGYVGIDMLLSYYDTYLNDSIVPEQYDRVSYGDCSNMICRRNSPGSLFDEPENFKDIYTEDGIKHMTSTEIQNMNTEYYNYMYQQKDVSLHAKLLTIGGSLGYYDYSDTYPAGASHDSVKNIIDEYLSTMLGFDIGDEYSIYDIKRVNSNSSNDVRNFVIGKISLGIPVLLSIRDEDNEGHWVIAYDYNENTDQIFCNFGWGSDATHITPENYIAELGYDDETLKNYYIYDTALTIEFNIPHQHSNNYAVTTTVNGEEITNFYCYDNTEIELYDNSLEISSINSFFHSINYECGDTFRKTHKYVPDVYICGESAHYRECTVCGYMKTLSHIFQYDNVSDNTRDEICNTCGYHKTVSHLFECSGSVGTTHYEACGDCGYSHIGLTNVQFTSIDENNHLQSCTTCSYTVQESHNFGYRGYSSTHHEKYCIDCGYVDCTERHSFRVDGAVGNYNRCIACGAMIFVGGDDIFPIQTIPPKDPEEETE